jgi:hypothetical protein
MSFPKYFVPKTSVQGGPRYPRTEIETAVSSSEAYEMEFDRWDVSMIDILGMPSTAKKLSTVNIVQGCAVIHTLIPLSQDSVACSTNQPKIMLILAVDPCAARPVGMGF